MRRSQRASALVTVLGVVAILAAVVTALSVSMHVESMRVDATVAAKKRYLAALSAAETAIGLLSHEKDLDLPLYGTVRELDIAEAHVRYLLADEAGKLPLEMIGASLTQSSARQELVAALLGNWETQGTAPPLDEPAKLISRPKEQDLLNSQFNLADDLNLRTAMTEAGYAPRQALFGLPDERLAGQPLGMLLRHNGPLKVNVNTAPQPVLEALLLAGGYPYEAAALLSARSQKPFASVSDIRERHVIGDRAFQATSGLLSTQAGPTCVCAEVSLGETREVFVAYVGRQDKQYTIQRFFASRYSHEMVAP